MQDFWKKYDVFVNMSDYEENSLSVIGEMDK